MIHKFTFKDQNIVMDIESGAVHIVSPLVFSLLDYYDNYGNFLQDAFRAQFENPFATINESPEEISEALSEINELIADGLLFTEQTTPADFSENRQPIIKSLCLHVSHDCNMACKYCFGGQGHFFGTPSLMSEEIGFLSIDFVLENSGDRKNLEVDFFGGEPLMNLDVVKNIVSYARKKEKEKNKNIRFTMTTNGMLLDDETIEYLDLEMDNVILSLDGRKEINDKMRTTINNKGTYDLIIDNFKRFAKKRKKPFYIRGTFTKHNLDFTEDVKHLLNLGFNTISLEPVVADKAEDYALTFEHEQKILDEYEKLAGLFAERKKSGNEFTFFHFNIDFEQGPCLYKRLSGCGAGTEYLAISPEGDIYPCHQFVGIDEFNLGNLKKQNYNNHLFKLFNSAHVYNKEDCKTCFAKYYCSGGCHANAWQENGDILKPYKLGCSLLRKRLECSIGIAASCE